MRIPIILAVFLLPVSLFAQKPLAVGDTVPDILFEHVLNYSQSKARLSDFQERLILIDFWATWCISCAHAFPRIDSLQSKFEGDLRVLLVNSRSTRDDLPEIQAYLTKWESRTGKNFKMTVAADDSVAENLFPHQIIPHYAWIYKGRLVALTSSSEVTAAGIRNVLDHNYVLLSVKKDLDTDRPLFSDASLPSDRMLSYSILLKGWYNGLAGGSRKRTKGGVVCGRALTNRPLLELYKTAAMQIDPALKERLIIIDGKDSSALIPSPDEERSETWYQENAYTIDVITPVEQADHLYSRMLEVLNASSGYKGFFEDRSVKCWVLRLNSKEKLEPKRGPVENNPGDPAFSLKNGTVDMLVTFLNNVPVTTYCVLNETGFTGKIDIGFRDVKDMEHICGTLTAYGLSLRLEERKMRVFVIHKE